MKSILTILFLIPFIFNVYSQEGSTVDTGKKSNVYDIQRNSLYFSYHFLLVSGVYERTIPIGNKSGIIAGGGIMQGVAFTDETNLFAKIGFLTGGRKHFFECGANIAPFGDDLGKIAPLVGYRFQSHGGFLLRIDAVLVIDKGTRDVSGDKYIDIYPLPGISIGYSF